MRRRWENIDGKAIAVMETTDRSRRRHPKKDVFFVDFILKKTSGTTENGAGGTKDAAPRSPSPEKSTELRIMGTLLAKWDSKARKGHLFKILNNLVSVLDKILNLCQIPRKYPGLCVKKMKIRKALYLIS